jgi:hypothetical protein
MKSARRHELEENQLALWLAAKAESVKPHLKMVGAAILAVVIAWLLYSYFSGRSQKRLAAGWDKFYQANDLKGFQAVVDEFENSPAGLAARQQLAVMQLQEGNRRLMLDRDAAMILLEDASKNFEVVARESDDAMMKQYATYQLARAYEALGQLENARSEYEKLGKTWPDSAYATAAKGRLEDLDRPATKEFYDWHKTARMQSLTERIKGLKPEELPSLEPQSPDPLALPDPPARKDLPGDAKPPEAKQPGNEKADVDNKAATDQAPIAEKPEAKTADPKKTVAEPKSAPPLTEPESTKSPGAPKSNKRGQGRRSLQRFGV